MAEGDIELAFVPDLGPLEAALRRAEGLVQGLAQSTAQANKTMAQGAAQTASEVVTLTNAEKALAAELKKTKAQQDAAAAALGITRAEYKRITKAIAAKTEEEARAAEAVARLADEEKQQRDAAAALMDEERRLLAIRQKAGETVVDLAAAIRKEKEERKQLASALGLNLTELKKLQRAEADLIAENERLGASTLSVEEALNRSRMQLDRKSKGLDIGTGRARTYHETLSLVADTTGELDSTLKGLGGALGVADDAMDKSLSTAGELFGGIEAGARLARLAGVEVGGVAASVGGFAAAAGLGAAGLIAFAGEVTASGPPLAELRESLKAAEERMDAARQRAQELEGALAELRAGEEDLELQLAVSTGALTEREAQTIQSINTIREKYGQQIDASKELIAAQQAQRDEIDKQLQSGRLDFDERAAKIAQSAELRASIDAERSKLTGLREEQQRQVELVNAIADANERAGDSANEVGQAAGRAATLTRDYASATREAEQAAEALARQQEQLAAAFEEAFFADYLDGLDQALFGTVELSRSQQTIENLVAATDEMIPPETLDRADQLRLILLQLETEGARVGQSMETALAKEAWERTPLEDSLVRITDELDEMAAAAVAGEEVFLGVFDALTGAVTAFTDLYMSEAQRRLDADRAALDELKGMKDAESKRERRRLRQSIREQKEAAKKAFMVEQAASIAQAVIAGILAAQQALTLGPVAGPIAAIAIGATSAANVAAIASAPPPEFRGGGRIQAAADNTAVPIIAHQGEHMLNTQGVAALGGHDVADRLNEGKPIGGGPMTVNVSLDGQRVGSVVVDSLERSPRGRQLTSGLRPRGRGNTYNPGRLR